MTLLTDSDVLARRVSYLCCALNEMDDAIDAHIHGEHHCFEQKYNMAMLLYYGAKKMADTPVEDEQGCTTRLEATELADKLDCYCNVCECANIEEEQDCTIAAAYTVDGAGAYDDLPLDPSADDTYYVLSGTNEGRIMTYNGSGWDASAMLIDEVIYDGTTMYINYGDGPVQVFPSMTATLIGNSQYQVEADVEPTLDRDIQLQGYNATLGWYNIAAATTEQALPQVVSLLGLNFTAMRVVYRDGECTNVAAVTTVIPPVGTCGDAGATAEVRLACPTQEFYVDIELEPVGFPVDGVIAVVDGAQDTTSVEAIDDTHYALGPYTDGQQVSFIVTNANGSDCNYTHVTTYSGYQNPDHIVTGVGDASVMLELIADGSGVWFISSDDNNVLSAPLFLDIGAELGTPVAVGMILNIDNYADSVTPDEDDTMLDTSTGAYYVIDSNGDAQYMFPEITATFDADTGLWSIVSSQPAAAAIETGDIEVSFMVNGSLVEVWSGIESDLATAIELTDFFGDPTQVVATYHRGDCDVDTTTDIDEGTVADACALTEEALPTAWVLDVDFISATGGNGNWFTETTHDVGHKVYISDDFYPFAVIPATDATLRLHTGHIATFAGVGQGEGGGNWDYEATLPGQLIRGPQPGSAEAIYVTVTTDDPFYASGMFGEPYFPLFHDLTVPTTGPILVNYGAILGSVNDSEGLFNSNRPDMPMDPCRCYILQWTEDEETWTDVDMDPISEHDAFHGTPVPINLVPAEAYAIRAKWMRGPLTQGYSDTCFF